ncbi:zinc carboxypeptidase, partial [candidate division WOR-3 bacterium]|nr:zinc carboxypeptidase [candidate division WOR-3 bacterium]
MKLCMALSVALMAASLLAAEGVRMEARIYVESPEQAAARLGGLLGELDICTVGRTDDGREFLVVFADAEELAQVRSAGLEVEVTWPELREKFRRMTGVDPEDRDGGRDFGYFFTYWEMIDTLRRLAALYPSIVDTFKLGPTFQNRVLWGLRISDHPTVDEPEPELFINGATHAREPLGTHACIHFAQLLCQGYGADSLVTWLVNNRETYIIPVMNPDGYVYNSDSGGSNAYWRKNRRGPVPPAIGIDLNRNYGYKWGYDNAGSSPTPASETYRGPSRFSEPETQLARDFMYAHQFRTSQDFHTYGRYNLYSWGYRNRMPDDSLVLKEMGDTFRVNNGYTLTGPIYRTIYPVNGNSVDYAQADTLKDSTTERKFITYGFCSELGINDFWYGWNLPAYVDSEVTKNVPNLYYLARVSGVFFDPQRVLVNDSAEGNRTLQLDPNEVANLWFRVRNRAIHPLDSAYQVTGRLISLDTMV